VVVVLARAGAAVLRGARGMLDELLDGALGAVGRIRRGREDLKRDAGALVAAPAEGAKAGSMRQLSARRARGASRARATSRAQAAAILTTCG
jgi:hypothetical protein